jgi:hypothetical protein
MTIKGLFLTCVFTALGFAQGSTTGLSFTQNYSFPPVGLASSETAQVNVINIAKASSATGATAPSCTGTITFSNASGTAIGSPVSFTTTGSEVFSTPLNFSQVGASGLRGEFVASVQLTGTVPSKAPCSLVFSLETFDTSIGATHVLLENSAGGAAVLPIPISPVAR